MPGNVISPLQQTKPRQSTVPNIRPSISNTRAIITTRWGNGAYRPQIIKSVESFYIDTALDNDADSWNLEIGDPYGELGDLLIRDNEVRVQIFGAGSVSASFLMTGIADEISLDEQGSIQINGRDYSSLATDSTAPPQIWKHNRAWAIVEKQAKDVGFTRVQIAHKGMVKKLLNTDGSESYWELWYRLYRREKMWLWVEPDSTLIGGPLNYSGSPSYFLGTPSASDRGQVRGLYIPAERVEITKSTQARIGEVWVYGHRGDNGFMTKKADPQTNGWLKRPRKIILDTDAKTAKGTDKLAMEEIFEGKVGALEIKVTIADPGYMVRQNKIARVNFPSIPYSGDFFVVGVRSQAGPDGFIQEIRLRERQYAISRRVPKDPPIQDKHNPKNPDVISSLGGEISGGIDQNWGDYFVKAAKKWHGPWDFQLFLATLLAICDQETTFKNERSYGPPGPDGLEWRPPPGAGATGLGIQAEADGASVTTSDMTLEQWRSAFANEPGQYVSATRAVGPMQLYSLGYKQDADDLFKPGHRDQFTGGRWHPEHNIMAAAHALRGKLQIDNSDSGRDIDMWGGVSLYGHNAQLYSKGNPTPYAISVKSKVYGQYLSSVKDAVKNAQDAAQAAKDGETDLTLANDEGSIKSDPTLAKVNAFWQTYHPTLASEGNKRDALITAAFFVVYHKDQIHYGRGSMNEPPPPNIPTPMDCSQFTNWAYRCAGVKLNGGNTGTQFDEGQKISAAQLKPGDLVFYDPVYAFSGHVAMYIGNGRVIGAGSESGPNIAPMNYRQPAGFRRYF